MFPNNTVALIIGQLAMNDQANVGLFIPEGFHEQAAGTVLQELHLAGAELGGTVERLQKFPELEKYGIVVFPCLDVHPRKTRKDFSNMCRNLFR